MRVHVIIIIKQGRGQYFQATETKASSQLNIDCLKSQRLGTVKLQWTPIIFYYLLSIHRDKYAKQLQF